MQQRQQSLSKSKYKWVVLWCIASGLLAGVVCYFLKASFLNDHHEAAHQYLEYAHANNNVVQRRASTVTHNNEQWQFFAHQTSTNKKISLNIYTQTLPVPVNAFQYWRIEILDAQSEQPTDVDRVEIDGGMNAHGHGLPTQPKISRRIKPGNYIVDGVRFNMSGEWQMRFTILYQQQWDKVDFNFEIKPPVKKINHQLWSDAEIAILKSLSLASLPELKKDPSNQISGSAQAAILGKALFFDASLSKRGKLSCASCHHSQYAFQDGLKTAQGNQKLHRNTPSLIGVAHHNWFYWDGRRDSLWSQALTPFEAKQEMANNRLSLVKQIIANEAYNKSYQDIFGDLPNLSPIAKNISAASPLGTETEKKNWKTIPVRERRQINQVFANVGKAIAAYEETLQFKPSRFDHYVAEVAKGQQSGILNAQEIAGLKLFISGETQCMKCHNGPLFSNKAFHNIGTMNVLPSGLADVGRLSGVQIALLDEFNCRGRYSDAPQSACRKLEHINTHEILGMQEGAFKVPTLRNLTLTAPYMHDGSFKTLQEVVQHYRQPPSMENGKHELQVLKEFDDADADSLVAFLKTLTGVSSAAHKNNIKKTEQKTQPH